MVLGLWDGHDAGAAVAVDGRIVAAVSEERLTRVKQQGGFPSQALASALEVAGIEASSVQAVAIAGQRGRMPARLFEEQYAAIAPQTVDPIGGTSLLHAAYQNILPKVPLLRDMEQKASARLLSRRLEAHGLGQAQLTLVDHHRAHAYTAGAALAAAEEEQPALLLTMDGYGDGVSTAVWSWDGTGPELLGSWGTSSSLGMLYGLTTRLLGFKEGEEGKVTGLASLGRAETIALGAISTTEGVVRVDFRRALAALRAAIEDDETPEVVARSVQQPLEQAVEAIALFHLSRTGARRLGVAGGLFANVSLNGRLAGIGLDDFGVFPAMGDSGLCVGAALSASPPRAGDTMPSAMLGPDLGELRESPVEAARWIAGGQILGVARGRMEFGPRALGSRSILFDPRSRGVVDRVNRMLERESFMPFAPILRSERWEDVFDVPRHAIERSIREMTIALPVRSGVAEIAPAAVHADGTARPQVVAREVDPWLWSLLEAFEAETDCPLLINTSFNRHREPIVCSAEDALASGAEIGLDRVLCGGLAARTR